LCFVFLFLCVAATDSTNFPLGINKVYIYLSIYQPRCSMAAAQMTLCPRPRVQHQRTTAAPILCGPLCSSSTRLGMLAPVTKELTSWHAVGIRGPGIKGRGDHSSCHRLGAGLWERLAVLTCTTADRWAKHIKWLSDSPSTLKTYVHMADQIKMLTLRWFHLLARSSKEPPGLCGVPALGTQSSLEITAAVSRDFSRS